MNRAVYNMLARAANSPLFDGRVSLERRVGEQLDELRLERCECGALRIVGRPGAESRSSACVCTKGTRER